LSQSKGDTILFLKKLNFTMEEIKEMTVLQVNMYIQRHNEPFFADNLNRAISRAKEGSN